MIERGEGVISVALVAAEQLRQAVEVEQGRGLELRPRAMRPTCAPSRANSRTTARPSPADAPVTTTTSGLPDCFKVSSPFLLESLLSFARQKARERVLQALGEARR